MIESGCLSAGDGGTSGTLPAGSVTNNGVLVFNRSDDWTFGGLICGTGNLIKSGSGALCLTGAETYSGSTCLAAGTLALAGGGSIPNTSGIVLSNNSVLDVSARADGKLTLNAGQAIVGAGTILGSLDAGSGSTVSPGTGVGVLTVTNEVTLLGVTSMELNKSAATNDSIQGATAIRYGGALLLTNLAGALSTNDSFRLFSALTYSGQFTNVQPPTPSPGLVWNFANLAANGTLSIGRAPNPVVSSIRIQGTNLLLAGGNGTLSGPYWVLSTTNLALPPGDWNVVVTNSFDASGNFTFTVPLTESIPQSFFRLQPR
jgi:autotransporter-associated beta strand protein